jgi:type VI secretion system protein ImpJ
MTAQAVHWHEGMFLRPHHLQAAGRHSVFQAQLSEKWDLYYNWGLRAIDLDLDALKNHRLVIRGLQARLRDGTLVSLPEDGDLPALDLKPAFESQRTLDVFLALPVLNLKKPNAPQRRDDAARYRIDELAIEDENTGADPQPLQVRRFNLQLLLSGQNQAGYEVLPIARLTKSEQAEALPTLDESYVPPVLACDAWKPLGDKILQVIYDRIGQNVELLAGQATSRGIPLGGGTAADALLIGQLRALNEAYALLGVSTFARGVHPLPAYLELVRLVGQLAIFDDQTRRPPDLPKYDHDDLGSCFYAVKNYINSLLDKIVRPDYEKRMFEGAGLRMQVALEPAWVQTKAPVFVGVKSPLKAEETDRLLTHGQLNMKIGSSERVDRIFQLGMAGLRFGRKETPPRALPAEQGLVYFEVNRDSEEWQHVQSSLSLAIRLNEHSIAGDIQGKRTLTIKTGGQNTTMEFALYVLKPER